MASRAALRNPDELWPEEQDAAAAAAAYRSSLVARLRSELSEPLVREQVIEIGQSYEARLAREHLAALEHAKSSERMEVGRG